MLKPISLFFISIIVLLFVSCKKEVEIVEEAYQPRNTHEAYEIALYKAGLIETALGNDWQLAAENALKKPLRVEAPFAEDFFVDETIAKAVGYQFKANRGHKIEIVVEREVKEATQFFLDVYRIIDESTNQFVHIASAAEDQLYVAFEPRADGEYVVRFQTELLRGGIFRIEIQKTPALAFPVMGKDKSAIGSLFGAPRDGGRRKHHGVDIFAKRHTPIIAPTEGRIRFVGERGLGGQVVWMRDTKRNQTLYFAHLHDILVEDDAYVYPGDTLGTVGNTGNARTTPPHLHFGIYKDGPVDPYNYIADTRTHFKRELADEELINQVVRANSNVSLKTDGAIRNSKTTALSKFQIMNVVGRSSSYYRVRLPNNIEGYVSYNDIEPVGKPIKRHISDSPMSILSAPSIAGFNIDKIVPGEEVKVLGADKDYNFIETSNGRKGWLHNVGGG